MLILLGHILWAERLNSWTMTTFINIIDEMTLFLPCHNSRRLICFNTEIQIILLVIQIISLVVVEFICLFGRHLVLIL